MVDCQAHSLCEYGTIYAWCRSRQASEFSRMSYKFKNTNKSSVSDQNGISPLYIMLEIYHSGREPSNCLLSDSSPIQQIATLGLLSSPLLLTPTRPAPPPPTPCHLFSKWALSHKTLSVSHSEIQEDKQSSSCSQYYSLKERCFLSLLTVTQVYVLAPCASI